MLDAFAHAGIDARRAAVVRGVMFEKNLARMLVRVDRGVAVARAGQHAMQQHVDAAADVAAHDRIVDRRTFEIVQRRADRGRDIRRGVDQRAVEIEQDRAHAGQELHALRPPWRIRVAMRSSATGRIDAARPALPNASKRALQTSRAAAIDALKNLRGSNSLGSFASARRIAPVIARRMSVSMLTLRTPCLMPSTIASTGTP